MGLRRKCVRRQEALPTCSRWPPSWPPPQVFSFKAECPRPGGGDTGSVPLTQPGGEKLVLCKAPGYLQNLVLALDIPLICALPLCPHLSTQDASTTSDWAPPQNTPCFMFPSSFSPSS